MQSLTFVLEATLLAPLVEFATSSSGHVEPRQGLALGWLGSVIAGLAVVFGMPDRTQVDSCYGIPEGPGLAANCDSVCLSSACKFDHNGNPIGWYEATYCHSETQGCQQSGGWSCHC
ncbi:MAG: hypothetical protein OXI58_20850 [Gemmatimonadota bacterium]|nr:hypothetical protein [Gemmatimonadota bacterium]